MLELNIPTGGSQIMGQWADAAASFDGLDHERTGDRDTAWQFTAHASGRTYSIFLVVRNRVLRMFDLHPGAPPPVGLIPTLRAYVTHLLHQPDVERRAPRSLAGLELHLVSREQWREMLLLQSPI